MFPDTTATAQNNRIFAWPGLAALKRIIAARFRKADGLSVNDLPESHYRDLGLPTRRRGDDDTRPLIILGPM